MLRHFFRSFGPGAAPSEYYQYLSGKLQLADLADMYPGEWQNASNSALCISLGKKTHRKVSQKISDKLRGHEKWTLVGGPPCQAYSLVDRSRRAKDPDFETDEKHFLYREYLKIITEHRPPVFVMENVKGLLSSKVKGELVLQKILADLAHPKKAVGKSDNGLTYRLYSLNERGIFNEDADPKSFLVNAEEYGVPQARHRMFIVGVRSDLNIQPGILSRKPPVCVADVIGDMPRIRSGVSKGGDSPERWRSILDTAAKSPWFKQLVAENDELEKFLVELNGSASMSESRYSTKDYFIGF